MLKIFLIFSLCSSFSGFSGIRVEKIEAFQSNDTSKRISFEFSGNYTLVNDIDVEIKVYEKNNYLRSYSNKLKFIGNKSAETIIDFNLKDNFYVLINIYNNENLLVKEAKLNFYKQDDCLIWEKEKYCKRVYKSEYNEGVSKDVYMNLKVNDATFNRFLSNNMLDVKNVKFNSEYDFENSASYLMIREKIVGYDLHYNENYLFPLSVENNGYKYFSLLSEYYVDLLNFRFSEENFNEAIKTNNIHFPFSDEYREYEIMIITEDYVNIIIKFNVATSDNLFGDCSDSKYCLKRIRYD